MADQGDRLARGHMLDQRVEFRQVAVNGQGTGRHAGGQPRAALVVEDYAVAVGQRREGLQRSEIAPGPAMQHDDRVRAGRSLMDASVQPDTGDFEARKRRILGHQCGHGVFAPRGHEKHRRRGENGSDKAKAPDRDPFRLSYPSAT